MAAVSMTLKGDRFPMTRAAILRATSAKVVEGWEVNFFLSRALTKTRYTGLREVMADLDACLNEQG